VKRVHAAPNSLMVNYLRNVLESHGIDCVLRNQNLAGALGELPPIECWPELWIIEDGRFAEAEKLVKKTLLFTGPTSSPWDCLGCGESHPGQFTACWKCGAQRGP
jgi:hypothetical protein